MNEFADDIDQAFRTFNPRVDILSTHLADALAQQGYVKDNERNQAHETEIAYLEAEIKHAYKLFDVAQGNTDNALKRLQEKSEENRQGRELLNEIRNNLHHPVEGLEENRWTGEERLSEQIRQIMRKYNV